MSSIPVSDNEKTVQKQLDAYNARDLEAFMAMWAEDAQYFEHPGKLLANGAAEIRKRHIERFKEPNLHAHLVKRIVIGNKIIDHELVTRTYPEGTGKAEVAVIYEVKAGKIANAWFIIGAPVMD